MSDIATNATLQGSCPSGSQWWTCKDQSPSFLGCCTSNPCNGIGCPASDLRPAGLGTGAGPDDCQNDSSLWPNVACPSNSLWYSCADTNPTFQGCCSGVNPCNAGGCPLENLRPAQFSATTSTVALNPSCLATTTMLGTATMVSASSTSTSLPAAQEHSNPPIAAIAGGIAGGVLFFALLVLAFYVYRRRWACKLSNSSLQGSSQSHYEPKSATQQFESSPPPQYTGKEALVYELGSAHIYQPVQSTYENEGLGVKGAHDKQEWKASANHNRVSELSGVTTLSYRSSLVDNILPVGTDDRISY